MFVKIVSLLCAGTLQAISGSRLYMPFASLGLSPSLSNPLARLGYTTPTPVQTEIHSDRPDRQRPARQGADRHRQDRSVRPADDRSPAHQGRRRGRDAQAARPGTGADPRARAAGSQVAIDLRRAGEPAGHRNFRRRLDRAAEERAAPGHRHHCRHPRTACSITWSSARSICRASRFCASTKPIACSTWASCRRCAAS